MTDAEAETETQPSLEAEDEAAPLTEAETELESDGDSDVAPGIDFETAGDAGIEAAGQDETESGAQQEPDVAVRSDSPTEVLSKDSSLEAADDRQSAVAAGSVDAPATAVLPVADSEAASAASTPALRMSNVSKSFARTRAVDAVNLEIPTGTFFGIVGPNGAGKTTTLSMIAGLLRPDAGTIEVGGVDLRRDPRAAKALMGVLPDRLRTFDRLTGRQLLHYYGVLRGLRAAVVAERTEDLARAFDLTAALARPVSDYSAGMTKKIMLAGAMIHAPRLLVLDEPFEAVDPVSSEVILDILSAYVARGGTVVLSSHGMELVERVCEGVAVIVAGQVLAQGAVDDVRGDHTLAERFVQLTGGLSDVEGLEWLHTYSD
ncbi:ABC transporter ATP-binding protein [Microbacterium sp. MM2322]|uniref:ABC transporter ATP-binding protein n=1 Tax=Microbacterium sp. MM2322 TaxID=3157631 RepID=UPI0032D5A979